MKLLEVDTLAEAREKLEAALSGWEPETELVGLEEADGRILAEDVAARENIPGFRRSSVDGYAVCAKDTAGATESIPVFLEIIEEISIGCPAKKTIKSGQCSYVPTGGMVPEGADAVVMVEYCELFDERETAVYASVPYGASVVLPGEDVEEGQLLLTRGTKLGPAQCGVLAAAGITRVPVFVPWKAAILSTGDELVEPGKKPGPGQVRDINTRAIAAYARQAGMEVVREEMIADDEELLAAAVARAAEEADLVMTSGGSSQGKKDMTREILNRASGGGVFTHGLALKPGKPTILGFDRSRRALLAGLPGHPVAALTVFELLLAWLWRKKTGQKEDFPLTARMKTNLASAPGKTTCLMVKLAREAEGLTAEPILGRSGLISTMAGADGYVLVDMNQEGLQAGETVFVHPFG